MEKDQYLLKKNPSIDHNNLILTERLNDGIQSKSNRRVGITRLGLRVHNFGKGLEKQFFRNKDIQQDSGWWAKRILGLQYNLGEEPRLLDTASLNRDARRLHNICFANGYFHPKVSYSIDTLRGVWGRKRQAKVTFNISEGLAYRINDVDFVIDKLNQDSANIRLQYYRTPSLLRRGIPYSHSLFEKERSRGTTQCKMGSFYSFEPSLINFVIDTNLSVNRHVDTIPNRARSTKWLDVDIHITESPPSFKIREIEFQLIAPQGLNPSETLSFTPNKMSRAEREELGLSNSALDSTLRIKFVVSKSLLKKINYNFLAERIRAKVGGLYSLKFDNQTRQMLRALGMFQYLLIRYQTYPNMRNQLKMIIEGRLLPQYEVKMGLEVFSNDITATTNLVPNAGLKLSMRNKNTLKKSQLFDLSLIGNVGYNNSQGNDPRNGFISYQFGAEASMQFYSFLFSQPVTYFLPDKLKANLSRYSPQTILSSSFNFRSFNGINQVIPGAKISYQWQHFPSIPNRAISSLTPLSVSYFDPQNDSTSLIFRALEGTRIKDWDFNERLTSRLIYSYTQQNYRESKVDPSYYFQIGVEYGGLIPNLLERFNLNRGVDRGPDTINSVIEWFPRKNVPIDERVVDSIHYGFFGKAFLEGKLFFPISPRFQAVVRGKLGASTPLFQTELIPKEVRFFSGGVNGLRGWQANTLGPGKADLEDFGFRADSIGNFAPLLSPGGDYLFEANAELRFRPISWIELAWFTDVGNVWLNRRSAQTLLPNNVAEKAILSRDNLSIGWDTGIGVRFDFAYLIIRLDLGLRLYNPQLIEENDPSSGWNVRLRQDQIFPNGFNPLPSIGLNYPF